VPADTISFSEMFASGKDRSRILARRLRCRSRMQIRLRAAAIGRTAMGDPAPVSTQNGALFLCT